jgi:hypothetical protein
MTRISQPFELKVDGQAADARRLECHFQSDPYPGGHHYELTISDVETIAYAKKGFGNGIHREIGEPESRDFLSFLDGIKQIKIGRENPPQFWANTIDDLEVFDDKLVLKGVCSPHIDE